MKNIFLLFLAFSLLLAFSCAGTPESDDLVDSAQSDSPIEEEIEEAADVEVLEKIEEIVGEVEEIEALEEAADVEELEEIEEIEEPPEPEVLDTELLPDEELLIEDVFDDDEGLDEPEELAEAEPIVQEEPEIEPELEEETVIAEEPQVTEAPQVVQAIPPPPEPVREQEPPVQTPEQTVPRQPVSPSLLGPAEAPTVDRDGSSGQGNIPFSNDPLLLRDEPPVPVQQGIIAPQNDEVVFSRVVRATVGQLVEIPFMGTGWVYLGELASRRGIAYDSSRRDSEGQSIIFRAEEAGTYVLKFYREVFVRGYILNDYVQVIVGESPSSGAGWFNPPIDRGRVVANPRWPSALEEAEILSGSGTRTSDVTPEAPPSSGESVTAQGTTPAQETVPYQPPSVQPAAASPPATTPPAAGTVPERQERPLPEDIIQRAKETFDAGNVAAAIALLDQFREYYPSGSDEAYWLYGQFYEANSPSRDILLSLDYYRRLVREYPQSSRISDARRRIAYLERFYINIQ